METLPEPEPGPNDIVVEVRAVGICGSDLVSFNTGAYVSEDQVLGHEFAGTVCDVGTAVQDLRPGQRVTAMPLGRCGVCGTCQALHPNLCRRVLKDAIGYGLPGAMAQRVVVPRARAGVNVFEIGHDSFAAAAMIEPLAVALRAVNRAKVDRAMTALVLGLGVIGQCIVQVLVLRGINVFGVDLSQLRQDIAQRKAPNACFGSSIDDALRSDGRRRRPDVVIDASGAADLIMEAATVLAPAGRLVVVSLPAASPPVDLKRLAVLELELVGSYGYDSEFAEAHRLVDTRKVIVDDLVTATYPLERVADAFRAAADPSSHLKVQLVAH